ncbi:MAG TPA: P1 family peptidase [Candidatus Saccharimonadales bacterium]|nr:P1 family peptidase [Candidatus Saccharimonadales bacterium]
MSALRLPLVTGIRVGHWTDPVGRTGCTIVLCDQPAVAGVDIRGGAPGTIETALLDPAATVPAVNAILLTGGSAFGLAAAAGILRFLELQGQGFAVGPVRVPIVPGAVIFDLLNGDPAARPGPEAGTAACLAATREPEEGAVGAGTGATVAKFSGPAHVRPGGIGIATVRAGAATVTAIIVTNALGAIFDPAANEWITGLPTGGGTGAPLPGANTTIGVIATDALLTKAQAQRVATAAHDGLARAIHPAHTDLDGDTLFCLSVGGEERIAADPTAVQIAAADATTQAIVRGVRLAGS